MTSVALKTTITMERAVWPLRAVDYSAYVQLMRALSPTRRVTMQGLKQLLTSPSDIVLFARDSQGVLCATARLHLKCEAEGMSGHVDDVVVMPAYRRQGMARALVMEVMRLAQAEQVLWLELSSNKQRVAAHALYESLGFEVYDTIVYVYEDTGTP